MKKTADGIGQAGTVIAFQQEQDSNVSKLYIYDTITKYGDFNWETWSYEDSDTSANHIRELLENIPEGNELEIHINSNGGEVYEAVTIYNMLCQFKGKKTSYVDGVAHSAAFIIPFACDWRVMGRGTASLFHNMWTYTSGNAEELRAAADRLDAMMASNRQIYLSRAKNITEEEMIRLMNAETILTPEQCLEYGFCDEIAGYDADMEQQAMNAELQGERMKNYLQAQENFRQQLLQLGESAKKTQKQEVAPVQPPRELNATKQKALKIASAFLN